MARASARAAGILLAASVGREVAEVADPPPVHFDGASEIFCNRALNLGSMQAVGFDLDYTLAEYIPHTFDTLAFNAALTKLVDVQGYPAAVLLSLIHI